MILKKKRKKKKKKKKKSTLTLATQFSRKSLLLFSSEPCFPGAGLWNWGCGVGWVWVCEGGGAALNTRQGNTAMTEISVTAAAIP